MKKSMRTVVLSCAVLVVLLAGIAVATASANQPEVRAQLLNTVHLWNKGEEFTLENDAGDKLNPLYYNGEVYLPVSALSDELGILVDWNQEKNILNLGGYPIDIGVILNNEEGLGLAGAISKYGIDPANEEDLRQWLDSPSLVITHKGLGDMTESINEETGGPLYTLHTSMDAVMNNSSYDESLVVYTAGVQPILPITVNNLFGEPIIIHVYDCDTGDELAEPYKIEANGLNSYLLKVSGVNRIKITREFINEEDRHEE